MIELVMLTVLAFVSGYSTSSVIAGTKIKRLEHTLDNQIAETKMYKRLWNELIRTSVGVDNARQ
jgi:hypothetical protein